MHRIKELLLQQLLAPRWGAIRGVAASLHGSRTPRAMFRRGTPAMCLTNALGWLQTTGNGRMSRAAKLRQQLKWPPQQPQGAAAPYRTRQAPAHPDQQMKTPAQFSTWACNRQRTRKGAHSQPPQCHPPHILLGNCSKLIKEIGQHDENWEIIETSLA